MHSNFIALALGLVLAGTSSAHPSHKSFHTKRTISPDNTCGTLYSGANNNYTCDAATNSGGCCSTYGYCGSTSDYCGDGCQSKFGTCDGGDAATETCGPNFNNAVCSNSQCCSQSGYCGTTSDYCADPGSCLVGFGRCDSDLTPAGPTTANAPRPFLGPVSYTDDIYSCVQSNVVALTYDDGPYIYTAQLLDILKQYGFQATFFMTGNNNGKGAIDTTAPYPDLIKRMIAEGHQVASHTWSHYSLTDSSSAVRISQMVKNEMAFNNIIGMWPTYMRPPYSQCSQASGCWADMQTLGYHRVYFDLDTQDYLNPSPLLVQKSKDVVKQQLANGASDYLAIQHDIGEQSVTNLTSYFFDLMKARGLKGVTAGDCLGDTDRTNWYRSLSGTSGSSSSSSSKSSTSSKTSTSSNTLAVSSSTISTTSPSSTKTTSQSTSTKPTSTSSTSTPKSTSTTTSSKSSSTSTKSTSTTSTKTSTTAAAPAPTTAKCLLTNGKWCGSIDPFKDKATCLAALAECYLESPKCLAANIFGALTCTKWSTICVELSTYCLKCGNSGCNNAAGGF